MMTFLCSSQRNQKKKSMKPDARTNPTGETRRIERFEAKFTPTWRNLIKNFNNTIGQQKPRKADSTERNLPKKRQQCDSLRFDCTDVYTLAMNNANKCALKNSIPKWKTASPDYRETKLKRQQIRALKTVESDFIPFFPYCQAGIE